MADQSNPFPPGSAAGMAPDDTSNLVEIRPSSVNEMRRISEESDLLQTNWEEIATNKKVMRLSPNWVRYYELEEREAVVMLAAWDGGEMVGYSVNFVYQHMHYSGLTILHNDVFYVAKSHRNGGLGARLIAATEEAGRKRECGMALFHTKPGSELDTLLSFDGGPRTSRKLLSALGRLLGFRGYGVQDILHSKVL